MRSASSDPGAAGGVVVGATVGGGAVGVAVFTLAPESVVLAGVVVEAEPTELNEPFVAPLDVSESEQAAAARRIDRIAAIARRRERISGSSIRVRR